MHRAPVMAIIIVYPFKNSFILIFSVRISTSTTEVELYDNNETGLIFISELNFFTAAMFKSNTG